MKHAACERFPTKAIITGLDQHDGWAFVAAGGSFPNLPATTDPALRSALRSLSRLDREALLLVAWDDLTPSQAARSLNIKPTAFRVRLLRARRRLQAKLKDASTGRRCDPKSNLDLETT